jgi:hypothetical protein
VLLPGRPVTVMSMRLTFQPPPRRLIDHPRPCDARRRRR